MSSEAFVHPSALVEQGAILGANCKVWHFCHIRSQASLGDSVIVGRNVYIGNGVSVGSRSKIQNNASIYEPSQIGEGVFVGPHVIFTNDRQPRAVNIDLSQKESKDWSIVGVVVEQGASIGAGAICVGPVTIGKWGMVAAGSVVIRDVPAFALVAGVPAKRIRWVGKSGFSLIPMGTDLYECPVTGEKYKQLSETELTPL